MNRELFFYPFRIRVFCFWALQPTSRCSNESHEQRPMGETSICHLPRPTVGNQEATTLKRVHVQGQTSCTIRHPRTKKIYANMCITRFNTHLSSLWLYLCSTQSCWHESMQFTQSQSQSRQQLITDHLPSIISFPVTPGTPVVKVSLVFHAQMHSP